MNCVLQLGSKGYLLNVHNSIKYSIILNRIFLEKDNSVRIILTIKKFTKGIQ